VELIVSIIALVHNLTVVVQTSLLGSILSNCLLVMGMSFFCGGMFHKTQYFNQTGAQMSGGLLMLSVMSILFPAAFYLSGAAAPDKADQAVLTISRITAIVVLIIYGLYLFFQLKTHKHLFEDDPKVINRGSIKEGQKKEGEEVEE